MGDDPCPPQPLPTMDNSSSYRASNSHLHHHTQQQQYSQPNHNYNYNQNSYTPSLDGSQQQQGRFTEEWDASQRGSSIIDGRNGTAAMERSASIRSYQAGDDQQLPAASLPSRGNTLKKKNSMRRSGSLRRSGSRRSMRAGSVKSLALHSSTDPDEAHSAFFCPVPTTGNPTEVLINRFQCKRTL